VSAAFCWHTGRQDDADVPPDPYLAPVYREDAVEASARIVIRMAHDVEQQLPDGSFERYDRAIILYWTFPSSQRI